MPYHYLEDKAIADIAFEATGESLEALFESSADAVTNVMIENIEAINLEETRPFESQNDQLDMLLFDFLQEIIFYKDSEQLLLRATHTNIQKIDKKYHLKTQFTGEFLDPTRHEQRVDVKAVTLHQFSVEKQDHTWLAHVILDI